MRDLDAAWHEVSTVLEGHGGSKYAHYDNGTSPDPRDAHYHITKALGHLRRAPGVDADSGHDHTALAAARCLLALRLILEEQ